MRILELRNETDLRPAQRMLRDELIAYPRGIAVLGMGGGKTCAALTAHVGLTDKKIISRSIVLAPARVVDNVWPHEPAKWAHLQHLDVVAVTGTPAKRVKIMRENHDVYVVSIDNAQWLVKYLKAEWKLTLAYTQLFIDEISRFRNPRSKRGRALMKIAHLFAGVWGLTGTPRPNGYEDLFLPIQLVGGEKVWGTFKALRAGMMVDTTDFNAWRKMHFYALDHEERVWEPHQFAIPGMQRIAEEWMVHGSVSDLGTPRLNTGDDYVVWTTMSDEQADHYETMRRHLITTGRKRGLYGDALINWLVVAMSQGVASGKLTQIVQGLLYLPGGEEAYRFAVNPKLEALREMDLDLGADSAVICYGYKEEVPMLEELLDHRTLGRLGGGISTAKANHTIAAWNRGEIDRLLVHPASAGHGIELQGGGHTMIWFHPTWSSELDDQMIKRLDRPGQQYEVFEWQLAMRGTNDEIKLARVLNKLEDEAAFKEKLRRLV